MAKKDKERSPKDEKDDVGPEKAKKKGKKSKDKEDASAEKAPAKGKMDGGGDVDTEKAKTKGKESKSDDTDPEKVRKKDKKKNKVKDTDLEETNPSEGSKTDSIKKKKHSPTVPADDTEDLDMNPLAGSPENENGSYKREASSGTTGDAGSEPSKSTVKNLTPDEIKEEKEMEIIPPIIEKFVAPVYDSLINQIPTECITLESVFDCLIQQIVSDVQEKDSLPSGAKIYRDLSTVPSAPKQRERKPKFLTPKLLKRKDYATSRVCHLQENIAIRLSTTEIRGNLLGVQNFLWNNIDKKHTRGMHLKSLANLYQFMQFIPTIKPDDLYYILHSLIVEGIGNYLEKVGGESVTLLGNSARQSLSNASIRRPRDVEELESLQIIPKSVPDKSQYIPGTKLLANHNYFAIDQKTKNKYLFMPEQNGKLDVKTLETNEQKDLLNMFNDGTDVSGYDADIETIPSGYRHGSGLGEFTGEAGEAEFVGEEGGTDFHWENGQRIMSVAEPENINNSTLDPKKSISQILKSANGIENSDYPTPPNTVQEKQCGQGDFNPFVLQQPSFERFVPCDNWDNSGINDPRIMQKLLDCSVLSSIHMNNGKLNLSSWAQTYLSCNGLCTPTDRSFVGPVSELNYIEEYSSHQMIQVLGENVKNYLSFTRFYNPFYDTLIFIFYNPNPSTLTTEESFMSTLNLSTEIHNFLEAAIADGNLEEILFELGETNEEPESVEPIDLITLMQIVPEEKWIEIPSIRIVLENSTAERLNELLELVYSYEEEEEAEDFEDEEEETLETGDVQNIDEEGDQSTLVTSGDGKNKRKKSADKEKSKGMKDKKPKEKGKKKGQAKDTKEIETTAENKGSSPTSTKKKKKISKPIKSIHAFKNIEPTKIRSIKNLTANLEFKCYDLGKRNLTHAADVFYLFPENGPILTYEISAIEPDYVMMQMKISTEKHSCVFYPYYVPTDMDLSKDSYVVVPYFHFILKNEIILAFSDLRIVDSSPRKILTVQQICTDDIINLPTEFTTFTMDQIIFISDKWKDKCRTKKGVKDWKKISKTASVFAKLKKQQEERISEETELMEEMLGELESEINEESKYGEEHEGEVEIESLHTQLESMEKDKAGRPSKDEGSKMETKGKKKSKARRSKKAKEKDIEPDEPKEKKSKKKDKKKKSIEDVDAKVKVSNKPEPEAEKVKTKKGKIKQKKQVVDNKQTEELKSEENIPNVEDENEAEEENAIGEWDEETMKKLGITGAIPVPSTPVLGYTFSWKDAATIMKPLAHLVSVTLPSGLNIKVEDDIGPPLARVVRQSHSTGSTTKIAESSRFYLSNGMVISFIMNKSVQIMSPRGSKTTITQLFSDVQRDETTNSKIFELLSDMNSHMKVYQGEVVLPNGEHYKFIRGKRYLAQPLAIYTSCPVPTGEIFRRRQDGVIFSYLTNGTTITHYPDGTRFTSSILLQIENKPIDEEFDDWVFVGINYLVEHPNYSSVEFNTMSGDALIQFTEDSSLRIYSDGLMQVLSSSDSYKVNINQYLAIVTSSSTIKGPKSDTFSAIKLFHSTEFFTEKNEIIDVTEDLGEREDNVVPTAIESSEELKPKKTSKKQAKKVNAPKPKKLINVQNTSDAPDSSIQPEITVMEQDLRKQPGLSKASLSMYSAIVDEKSRRKTTTLDDEVVKDSFLMGSINSKNISSYQEIEGEDMPGDSEIKSTQLDTARRESLKHFLTFTDTWTFCKVSDTVDNRFAMDIYGQIVVNKSTEIEKLQKSSKPSTAITNENTKIVVVKRDLSGFEFLQKNYVNELVANCRNSKDGTVMTIDPLPQGRRLINLMEPLLTSATKSMMYKDLSIRPKSLTNKHISLTLNYSDLNWFGYVVMNTDMTEPSFKEREKYKTVKGQYDERKFAIPDNWKKLESNIHPSTKFFEMMDFGERIGSPAKSKVQLHYEELMSESAKNPVQPQVHKCIQERSNALLTRKIIEIPKIDENLVQMLCSASQSYSKTVDNYINIYANYEALDPRSNHEKETARLVKQRFFEQNLESMHLFEQESGKAMLQFHF